MFIQLSDVVTAYRLPSGRAVFAGRDVLVAAQALSVPELVARATAFLDAANATHSMEIRYRLSQAVPQYSPSASDCDALVDRNLGSFDRTVSNFVELASNPGVDPELGTAARLLSREVFPRGLSHVTTMSFPEEYETVAKLLDRLQGEGDLAGAVARLSLQPFVAALATANTAYGIELQQTPKVEGPTWNEIRASQGVLHGRQLELIAVVIGAYPDADAESGAQRSALLEPLMVQQRALAALYKARRGSRDVDPTTGLVDPKTPEVLVTPPVVEAEA